MTKKEQRNYSKQENLAALMCVIAHEDGRGKKPYMDAVVNVSAGDGWPGLLTSVITLANGLNAFEAAHIDKAGHCTLWDSFEWYDLVDALADKWAEEPVRTAAQWQEVCRAIIAAKGGAR